MPRDSKKLISVEEYFEMIGIRPMELGDIPIEMTDPESCFETEKEYYRYMFHVGLDKVMECVNYHANVGAFKVLRDVLVNKAGAISSATSPVKIIEPCSRSGIMGCFLALSLQQAGLDFQYEGNEYIGLGVTKSNNLVTRLGLRSTHFSRRDTFKVRKGHDIVVGHNLLSSKDNFLDKRCLEHVSTLGDTVLVIQSVDPGFNYIQLRKYQAAFSGLAMDADIVFGGFRQSNSRHDYYVISAERNPS